MGHVVEKVTLSGHVGSVNAVSFSPDGKMLATGSGNLGEESVVGEVKLWDLSTRKAIFTRSVGSRVVYSLAFSPNGKSLVAGTLDGSLVLWDVPSGQVRLRLSDSSGVYRVVFSPDGKSLATGGADSATVRIWDAETGKERIILKGQTGQAIPAVFSPDGRIIASGMGETILLSEASSGRRLASYQQNAPVTAVAFSPDGKLLAASDIDEFVSTKLWDMGTGQIRTELPVNSSAIAFHPGGKMLATGIGGMAVQLWDVSTGEPRLLLKGHDPQGHTRSGKRLSTGGIIRGLAISPDGRMLAAGSDDETVILWDLSRVSALVK